MPEALGPAHWRARAAEAQRDAERVKDPIFKHGLLNIAMSYEAMARLAERAEEALKKAPCVDSG
jgi:hypothetical protein